MSTREDLDETVRQVKDLGRRVFAAEADVRDYVALQQAFDEGVAELGAVTIVVANAGIGPGGLATADEQWDEVVDVKMRSEEHKTDLPSLMRIQYAVYCL